MQTQRDIHPQVQEALARLGTLVFNRDSKVLSEFADDALLVGSEPGELAQGSNQLREFFKRIFARPVRFSWQWHRLRVSSEGELAWLFAEGEVVMVSDSGEKRAPYRLSGVLQWKSGEWVWRQFHGAEPSEG